MLDLVQKRSKQIYLSIEITEDNMNNRLLDTIPPYVTLCLEGKYPLNFESIISPKVNVVLKFSTSDIGYLCQAPETTVKNAILAAKLGEKVPIHG